MTIVREWRGGQTMTHLTGWQARVYAACDRIQGHRRLREIADPAGESPLLDGFLDRCIHDGLLVRVDERFLALGVYRPALQGEDLEMLAARTPLSMVAVG
jgi:hypothetical protein